MSQDHDSIRASAPRCPCGGGTDFFQTTPVDDANVRIATTYLRCELCARTGLREPYWLNTAAGPLAEAAIRSLMAAEHRCVASWRTKTGQYRICVRGKRSLHPPRSKRRVKPIRSS